MPIEFRCSQCGQLLRVPETATGKSARCPKCQALMTVPGVATVVPGHGGPIERDRALRLLDEDTAYIEALAARGSAAELPMGRRTATQRRIHAENVARV